ESDALVVGALASANVGALDAAVALSEEAIVVGRELGSIRIPAMARLAIARASVRRGEPAAASRALSAARTAVRSRGLRVMHADVAETNAMMLLDRGAWSRVAAASDELDAALAVVPMALWEPLSALISGRALLGLGRHREAFDLLDEAHRSARRSRAEGTVTLATAVRAQAKLLAGSTRDVAPDPAGLEGEAAAIWAENHGIAALHGGDPATALSAFDRAVEGWREVGITSWLARALAMRGRAHQECGDRARAAASIGRARAVMEQL